MGEWYELGPLPLAEDTMGESLEVIRYRRQLIEECAAGAVVETIAEHVPGSHNVTLDLTVRDPFIDIPIANAPPSDEMCEDVARELLGWGIPSTCEHCKGTGNRRVPLQRSRCPHCESGQTRSEPPFAAAWHEAGGVRRYVLVSAECDACGGVGMRDYNPGHHRCIDCSGTGARVDVGAIARRYGGDGDARVARFEVER